MTKHFCVDISYKTNEQVLKTFITKYVEQDNMIVIDGWMGYSFLNTLSGYFMDMYLHGGEIFVLVYVPPLTSKVSGVN